MRSAPALKHVIAGRTSGGSPPLKETKMDDGREAFEAYIRRAHPHMRLHRQVEALGGQYRTMTVQRAWKLWQASREHALEKVVEVGTTWSDTNDEVDQMVAEYRQCANRGVRARSN
jgi:hypothetical protein